MANEFLLVLGFAWILAATIQDLKTREVANWLTFSFIAFGLAYRAVVSAYSLDVWLFIYGVAGVLAFTLIAYAFYYGRIFAGGDAKLLIGLGGVLPYTSLMSIAYWVAGFVLLLCGVGAAYSLLYSSVLTYRARRRFWKPFLSEVRTARWLFVFAGVLCIILALVSYSLLFWLMGSILIFCIPLLYVYLYTLDRVCMQAFVLPAQLQEGDWLLHDVRRGSRVIASTVHGLSREEIAFLQKRKQRVWIKQGIPFVPAFLLAYGIMVYAVVILEVSLEHLAAALG